MTTAEKTIAVIVAHPDDETLWAGSTLINHPSWQVFIACLCRKDDPDRSVKFNKVLQFLGAKGKMGDMDDGPEQQPLPEKEVQSRILKLLPHKTFDLIISHSPKGEYTRHRRHEEIGKAVIKLWHMGKIHATALWNFAYEDGNRAYYPKAITKGTFLFTPDQENWKKKYKIMTEIYGFTTDSWEANTTPEEEAFWQFNNPGEALRQLNH